jgi:high-affinity iron transporter
LDLSFVAKATGIVFRESFEAVLIYGIIVSYFRKQGSQASGLKSAQLGLVLGVVASVVLGIALASAIPQFSPEIFSYIELFIVFGGSLMMLYMVFWMSEHSKHFKSDIESGIQKAGSTSIVGAVFVAVFREGIEAVVYLYSLTFEKPTLAHRSAVLVSLLLGVALAFIIYRLMLQGAKHLSLRTVFRISGVWLLISSSSLVATGIDKLFSAGFLESWSSPVFNLEIPEALSKISAFLESFAGFRFQPSALHLILFCAFWAFVIYKDPLKFWRVDSAPAKARNA